MKISITPDDMPEINADDRVLNVRDSNSLTLYNEEHKNDMVPT